MLCLGFFIPLCSERCGAGRKWRLRILNPGFHPGLGAVTPPGSMPQMILCPLPIAHCPLPIALCPLPIAFCSLPFAPCPLPIAHCPLRTAHRRLPTAHRQPTYPSFAWYAMAYNFIFLTMATRPLERVGERFCFNPISSMK